MELIAKSFFVSGTEFEYVIVLFRFLIFEKSKSLWTLVAEVISLGLSVLDLPTKTLYDLIVRPFIFSVAFNGLFVLS